MLKNYIKIAWRNLVKGKIYSFINITGLAVGIACCLLIGLYVFQQLRFDRFNEHSNRIYRVNYVNKYGNGVTKLAQTPIALAGFLKRNFSEVEKAAKIFKQPGVVRLASHQMFDENFLVAGKDFFKIFSFHLRGGNPGSVMSSRD
ncbi:MAG TPA: ABC transporter permease, partial [Balneolaceae bacterium]|nr:ABC transporter permease [Balneolaceae bacterium]